MDIAELCRASRRSASSAWKGITAISSLRFPDDTQEGRFVQNAGEHGLGVMRYFRSSVSLPEMHMTSASCTHNSRSLLFRSAAGKLLHVSGLKLSQWLCQWGKLCLQRMC